MYCLTGNVEPSARLSEGSYGYFVPGTRIEKFPARIPEPDANAGPVALTQGGITDGKRDGVEWDSYHLAPSGVEIVFDLGQECLVEKIVIHHSTSPSAFCFHDDPHTSGRGISRVDVRLFSQETTPAEELVCSEAAPAKQSLPDRIELTFAGRKASEVRIHLANRVGIGLKQIEIWGDPLAPAVYPTPQNLTFPKSQPFVLGKESKVIISSDAPEDSKRVVGLLKRKVKEQAGIELSVQEGGTEPTGFVITSKGKEKKLPSIASDHPEAYALSVDSSAVLANANSPLGLQWAAATLLDTLRQANGKPCFEPIKVNDHPDVSVRGLHLFLPAEEDIPFFKRLMEYLSLDLKYNTLFLEIAQGMTFERHPELMKPWEDGLKWIFEDPVRRMPSATHTNVAGGKFLSKQQVAEIVEHSKSVGIEVIPEFQCLSHAAWYLLGHREVAENPKADIPNEHCPSNPATYELIFDLLDELLEVTKPNGIHIGHDECRIFGKCPRCKGKSGGELFADDVNKMYDYLKERGLKTYMWNDHLTKSHNGRFYGTRNAIDAIPKDVVQLNWTPRSHLGPIDELVDAGFEEYTAGGYNTLFKDKRYLRERGGKPYRDGYVLTTWTQSGPHHLGVRGSLTDFVYCSENLWSHEVPVWEGNLYWAKVGDEVRRMRRKVLQKIEPEGAATVVELPVASKPASLLFPVDGLPRTVQQAGGIFFVVEPAAIQVVEHPERRRPAFPSEGDAVFVGKKCRGLAFLVTALGSDVSRRNPLGTAVFHVRYTDGSEEEIPLVYDINYGSAYRYGSGCLSDAHPLPESELVWLGDIEGRSTALFGTTWNNPEPDREIATVRLVVSERPTPVVTVWLGLTALEKC